MSNNEVDGEKLVGCFLAIWSLLITSPIWLVLLFVILNALGDAIPVWAWVLYWVYVPSVLLGIISAAAAKAFLDSR